MKTVIRISATLCLCTFAFGSVADEQRPDHFKGQQVGTLSEAVTLFRDGNQKLQQLLQGELTPAKMVEIHQLTYTLENALDKIHSETMELKNVLEDVHLGSESMDFGKVKQQAKHYLDTANTLSK
ncbi:MAG: hypothetical protein CML20_20680 [Rheinheimera sp.]|uniref:DUF6746 family protein n=1 Tax=Arsukibacterium sp. UBA3155 TaxID=1946058 RepID=UPI000C93DC0C|nr:DUF6746 family protein [Arsukibacterium sp. UBA3155]MAD77165.1 hypothetical protein [Rheinheimera sp.]|tara:strand:- start:62763 stop:63137 length:375 start_codon:yes stop_codon:yes gene_type:complete